MSSLPTAYANQRFGRKSLDFYAAAGDVIGADPRARADERRLQDLEGARHTVRLMETGFHLDPGEQASVLRMQPGPERRSRPVAVVNHTHGAWSRTHPGASGLLARAGVARSMNWALTMALFALAALVVVWPYLRAFIVEIDPAVFERAPQFDIFALTASAAPPLDDWRLVELTAGLAAQIGALAPGLEAYTAPTVFAGAVLAGALMVYALRSWRLVWAPVFTAALGVGALGFDGVQGAVTPALSGLAIAAAVFAVFGLVNKVRDAARLERRIAVLADHILRNPPEEMVAGEAEQAVDDAPEATHEPADEAPQVAPVAVAAAYRSGDQDAPSEAEDTSLRPEAGATRADGGPAKETDGDAEAVEKTAPRADADESSQAPEDASQSETSDGAGPEAQADPQADVEADPEIDAQAGREAGQDVEHGAADEDSGPDQDAEDDDAPANTFEQEETERLRTDPRYASRAIVLPPPPPMPAADETHDAGGDDAGEASGNGPSRSGTRTLKPGAPLPSNVVPMFAPPAPARSDDEPVD